MVEFARATVEPPRLLLLDEPASGLDDKEAARLGEQLQAVRAATGCAVLLVEHNAGFVMKHSDRVVVLALGSLLAQGSPAEVQANPMVREAYLGQGGGRRLGGGGRPCRAGSSAAQWAMSK